MAQKILLKRGLQSNLSNLTLSPGEPAVTLDTLTMYVGDSNGDPQIVKASAVGSVSSADKLTTARNIALGGDITGNVNFDGGSNVTINTTLPNITTAGTKPKVSYNAKGLITGGNDLVAGDIPELPTSKISGLDTALTNKADLVAGKIPTNQLPSFVDDVVEAATLELLPVTGETGKIYVTTSDNVTYRWSGSGYVEISASIALGETSSTAYRGDKGKIAFDHSQVVHDKILVGLGNVDNTADSTKEVLSATKLKTARNINGVAFDGSKNITIDAASLGLGNVTNESKATMFNNATLTGNSTAVTQALDNDSTRIATTAFVQGIVAVIDGGTF